MNESKFSASSSALGYLYQLKLALFFTIESNDEAIVNIEKFDDLEIVEDGSKKIIQVKNRAQDYNFSDYSIDLWKTLRIWSNIVKCSDSRNKFVLVTTATAEEDSATCNLRYVTVEKRNPKLALEKLETVAKKSDNNELKNSFNDFLSLNDEQKERLVNNIYVLDSYYPIEKIDEAIKKKLELTVRSEHIEPIYDRLNGWWFQRVVSHLIKKSEPIFKEELHLKICDIRDQFNAESLPIDFLNSYPDYKLNAERDNRLFVQQLKAIGVNFKMIEYAMLDYYRAFSQRSKWVRDKLVLGEELNNYEERLIREWDQTMIILHDKLPKNHSEEDIKKLGKDLFYWMLNEANIKIRPRVEEKYVMRGSYHILADENNPRIWWHPEFINRLKTILSQEIIT